MRVNSRRVRLGNALDDSPGSLQNVLMHIVAAGPQIADLEKQATELEKKAESAQEPEATKLKEAAKERRGWAAELMSGRWHS